MAARLDKTSFFIAGWGPRHPALISMTGPAKGTDGLTRYRQEKNAYSLDGLPGLEADD